MNSVLFGILAVISLFLQVLHLNDITLMNYIPNIIIPILVFSQFYLNSRYHTVLFFLIGLMLDCSNPLLFGTFTFSFITISYLVTLIKNHLDLKIFTNKLVLIASANALFYLIYNLLFGVYYHQSMPTFFITLGISITLNSLLSVIVIGILDFIRLLKLDLSHE